MGVHNYLIEGLSGTGKTTVAEALQRRGYHVIHGDRQFAYYGDPETGAPLDWPVFDSDSDKVAWGYRHWIWPVERVKALIADRSHPISFFCGGSRNRHHFIALFDKVFVLEADAATLDRRLAARPADIFGGQPAEREFNTRLHASGENDPANAIRIDATAPLADVIDAIIAACEAGGGGDTAGSE
ncbi:nucleoside kinase [Devosia insulae DS-56]|uniref:Nucleoside kinase n=1 Tax=Devosia insulae DS-56 TaxID=1116389 RepID=A0A1E5XNL5_9HYPH|nr:nucleoside kinase [Devosia insulae]OEO30175.1 nucleoside kinase [Devosia insulae DS-56]